jgi:hypothetical protein
VESGQGAATAQGDAVLTASAAGMNFAFGAPSYTSGAEHP